MFSNFFFPPENRAVYEIMWKNIIELYRLQMTILRMCIELWVTKVTKTYLQYVIYIAFPLKQWLHVTLYVHCLSFCYVKKNKLSVAMFNF